WRVGLAGAGCAGLQVISKRMISKITSIPLVEGQFLQRVRGCRIRAICPIHLPAEVVAANHRAERLGRRPRGPTDRGRRSSGSGFPSSTLTVKTPGLAEKSSEETRSQSS